MTKKIIGIAGMCGSGKSEAVKYLVDQGFEAIYFGGTTIAELKKRGLAVNEVNEKEVREGLRKEYGMAAFAILNLENIEQAGDKVVIDGIYSWDEYKVLEEKFKEDFRLVAIVATKKLRYQRLTSRPVRPLTAEQIKSRDYAEIENIAKGGPIAIADYTIVNDGSVEDLRKNLDKIINE